MVASFAETDQQIKRAESGILKSLSQHAEPVPPFTVISDVKQTGISESIVRSAIWFLLDRDVINLTVDRKLSSSAKS